MQRPQSATIPDGVLLESADELFEGGVVVHSSEAVEVSFSSFFREVGATMDIGDAPPHLAPSLRTVGVPFLGAIDLEIAAFLDGGLGAQNAACRGEGLVIELDRVPID